jgi:hypothetical protein
MHAPPRCGAVGQEVLVRSPLQHLRGSYPDPAHAHARTATRRHKRGTGTGQTKVAARVGQTQGGTGRENVFAQACRQAQRCADWSDHRCCRAQQRQRQRCAHRSLSTPNRALLRTTRPPASNAITHHSSVLSSPPFPMHSPLLSCRVPVEYSARSRRCSGKHRWLCRAHSRAAQTSWRRRARWLRCAPLPSTALASSCPTPSAT